MNYRCQKFGDVAEICTVKPEDDLMLIASDGVVIRIPMDSISMFNRPAKGVRVMKVNEGAKLITAAVTDKVEETPDEEDGENAENAGNAGNAGNAVNTDAENGEQIANGEVIAEHGVEEARDALLEAADKPMEITEDEADE